MIQSGYNPQGGNLTTTQGQGFGGPMGGIQMAGAPSLPFDPTAALRDRLRVEAEQRAFENKIRSQQLAMQKRQAAMQEQGYKESRRNADVDRARMGNHAAAPKGPDPLSAMKRMDQYDATVRGAATRPTGLGAQMIPGMAADPNLLPSRLRPSGSSFQGQMGPSGAGLSPSAEAAKPLSNRGYDFADPYSQALVQQASFGRR